MATRLEPIQILENSMKGSKQDPKRIHAAMASLVKKDPKFRVMRANNTLFSYYNLGNGNIDMSMDTADNPRDLVDSIKQFAKALKVAKFKNVKFQMNNPQVEKILKMTGLQYQLQPMPNGQMMAVVQVP
jgi:hypothetical protein